MIETSTVSATRQAGFTLIEVLLAVMIAGVAMLAVTGAFLSTLRTHYAIDNLTSSTEAGQRVLALLERDLRGLWHFNIERNAVFRGRNLDIGGSPADRIDLLTSSDAIGGILDTGNRVSHPGVCEVGYWLKENTRVPGLLELWRREDPLVDGDLLTDGNFQLVTDRLKSFNIQYYETLGFDAEPLDEWDSQRDAKLPRRLRVEFTLLRRIGNRNEIAGTEVEDYENTLKTYVRHIVLDRRYTDVLLAGVAIIPIAPTPPTGDQGTEVGGEGESGEGPLGGGGGGGGPGRSGPPAVSDVRGGEGAGAQPPGRRGDGAAPPMAPPTGQPPLDLRDLLRGIGGSGNFLGGR